MDGWSLNKGSVTGLAKTLGQGVCGVWLVDSCQNTIYQAEKSETAEEIIFKREKALTIFNLYIWAYLVSLVLWCCQPCTRNSILEQSYSSAKRVWIWTVQLYFSYFGCSCQNQERQKILQCFL